MADTLTQAQLDQVLAYVKTHTTKHLLEYDNLVNWYKRPIAHDWTPTYSGSSTMTFTGVTTNYARYTIIGNHLFFNVSATGTAGGVANSALQFTYPPYLPFRSGTGSARIVNAGNFATGQLAIDTGTTIIAVLLSNSAPWTLGSVSFIVTGFYEIA